MSTPTPAAPAEEIGRRRARHECGIACTGSRKPVTACECECGGRWHGALHLPPEQRPGYRPIRRDPFAGIPVDDEPSLVETSLPPFGPVPPASGAGLRHPHPSRRRPR